jgi:Protein of unknown function (DUF2889)
VTGKKLLHTRTYDIEAFVDDDRHLRLVGRMHDVRPDGLWGIVDTEPMSLHDMRIELVIDAVTFAITAVETAMVTHPQEQCPLILPIFQQLVGTSIARGFGSRVKSLFGGPRSCTHFVALLNAMAPVAMQARWSFFHATSDGASGLLSGDPDARREGMRAGQEANRDTCHVWATDGPMFAKLDAGLPLGPPLWAKDRLAERGIPLEDWVTL